MIFLEFFIALGVFLILLVLVLPDMEKDDKNIEKNFKLTPDEVEIVERNLVCFFKSDKEEVDKILTRIKQYKDEKDKSNNTTNKS